MYENYPFFCVETMKKKKIMNPMSHMVLYMKKYNFFFLRSINNDKNSQIDRLYQSIIFLVVSCCGWNVDYYRFVCLFPFTSTILLFGREKNDVFNNRKKDKKVAKKKMKK